ncbi:uncharacterized protein LOC144114738 isoform X2 [Amblyomma americanum]
MQVTETICAELFNRFNHGHRATWVQPGVGPTTFIIWQVASVLIATVTCMLPALLTSHWSVPSRHAPEWKKSELDTDFVTVIAAVQAPSVDAWELDRRWAAQATGTSIYQQDIKGQPPSATLCGLGGCATKLLANPMVFAMQGEVLQGADPWTGAPCSAAFADPAWGVDGPAIGSVKAALAGAGVLCGATPLSTTSAKYCFAVKENVFHGFLHSSRSAGLSHIHQNGDPSKHICASFATAATL